MRNLKTMIPPNAPLGPQGHRWAALAVLPTLLFIARLASAQGLWIEGWQQANPVRYYPDPNDPFLIAGDAGTYIVGATNDDPDTPDYAELSGPAHDRTLHLHTEDDNMWVANISPFNLTVRAGARLAIRQSGALVNPTWGGWKPFPTVSPPPGENVYLRLHDSQGNQLVYLFQRPPNYPEHSLRMDVEYPGLGIRGYREIFLGAADAAGGEYVRDLYEDLRNTPGVDPHAILILAIEFGMNGTGDARFGPLRIGDLPTAPPIIAVQPQDLSVPVGSPLTLSVQATGLGPLQYQWRKDGVPLPGANAASYTLTAATASDAGTYVVVVSNAGGSTTSTPAVVRVLEAGLLEFAAPAQTVSEINPVARVAVRRLAGTAGAVSVFYETRTQTAVAGFDFQYRNGKLEWADGDATDRFIDVPILNDTVVEPLETFEVILAAPAGGARLGVSSAVVTIVSEDVPTPGKLELDPPTYTVQETNSAVRLTVRRLEGTAGAVTVFYETRTQTAVAGFDFQYRNGKLEWADGDATDRFIDVPILNDTVVEPLETFEVILAAPAGGARLGVSSAVVTIVSEDVPTPGRLELDPPTYTVQETNSAVRLTVRRLEGTAGAVTVFYETRTQTAVAGFDFQYRNGKLEWADGDATDRFIDVPILNDTVVEPLETFEVILAAPAGGARLGVSSAVVTIVSDDLEPPRLVGFVLRPEGGCAVRLLAVPGLAYDLEYTADFHTWTEVRHIEVTQPETPVDLPRPEGVARAFYRAVHR